MWNCIGLRNHRCRVGVRALVAPFLLVIFGLEPTGCTSPGSADGGNDTAILSDVRVDVPSDLDSILDTLGDDAMDAVELGDSVAFDGCGSVLCVDAHRRSDALLDATDAFVDDVLEMDGALDSEATDSEATDVDIAEVIGTDTGAVQDVTPDQSTFDGDSSTDVGLLDTVSDTDDVASDSDAMNDTADMEVAEADTEDVGSSSLCPDWSQQGWTSDPPYDLCSPVVVQASLKTSIIPDVTNTATPFPTPGVLDHVIDFGAKFTYKWGDPLGIYEFQGGTLQALSVGPNDTVWLGWHQWVAPPKPPQVDPGLLINQIFVGRTSKDDVTVTSFPLGGTLLSTTPLHTVHWVTTAASGEVFAHVAAPGLYSVDSGPDFPQWALFLLDPSGPELLFPSPEYSAGIPALTKVTMQGDDFVCMPWLLPPGQLNPPDCADWSLARIAATGEPLWSTFVGNDGSGDGTSSMTGEDDPVVLGNCGYAAMEMLYYIPSEIPGYPFPKLPRVSYFTVTTLTT